MKKSERRYQHQQGHQPADMDPCLKDLLKELMCPICLEYIRPPIPMCENGHSVCKTCRQKLLNCPVCRGMFSYKRCFLLENMTKKMKYPCKYYNRGCPRAFYLQHIEEHEDQCQHQPSKCPFSFVGKASCTWEGSMTDIRQHMENKHMGPSNQSNATGSNNGQFLCEEIKTTGEWYTPIFRMGEIFFLLSKIINNNLYVSILQVALKRGAPNYSYKVTMKPQDGSKNVSLCRAIKPYLSYFNTSPTKHNSAIFQEDCWKKCIDAQNRLVYRIEIFTL
ncbi:E3 ubiquitin-protein ligase sina-like isoform X2 [Zootermopsis nevadensis]|uniref:E3 ubiquitin-protein ligase sina-like isoform X2 n=1 Tax=Zootermopsis nevadensis TaxID=136037 RepID=UPI000B8E641F|nr:E3 ubiquitin-protein ligase sina-like isoform X2 [Zootermopsis nevadensis]